MLKKFARDMFDEGFNSYATQCAPQNTEDEAWEETEFENTIFKPKQVEEAPWLKQKY